jgi:hypothetical protein
MQAKQTYYHFTSLGEKSAWISHISLKKRKKKRLSENRDRGLRHRSPADPLETHISTHRNTKEKKDF